MALYEQDYLPIFYHILTVKLWKWRNLYKNKSKIDLFFLVSAVPKPRLTSKVAKVAKVVKNSESRKGLKVVKVVVDRVAFP